MSPDEDEVPRPNPDRHWVSGIGKILRLRQGDITRVEADAIGNAANSGLLGGGGVDGAIHRAAGPTIMAELKHFRPCPTGKAVVTGAGKLRAKYIIHAVGPVYRGGNNGEAELLASCYRECLRLAAERECRSLALPAISTGVYGYPMDEAATIATGEVKAFLEKPSSLEEVIFVLFGAASFEAYARHL